VLAGGSCQFRAAHRKTLPNRYPIAKKTSITTATIKATAPIMLRNLGSSWGGISVYNVGGILVYNACGISVYNVNGMSVSNLYEISVQNV
jgi:hypothetical protein